MQKLIQVIIERKTDLLLALWQHVQISIIALVIAMLIAIPLAIWVVRHRRFSEFFLQLTSILQTIPSLALLGLLIPFVGIGTLPAIIALVVYALLPIFQNTYLGISEIDPSIEEAADAFGMSSARKLFKVELPIAMPQIISGIRTALVLIIGTATLAALIGAGGLGTFIMLGIDRNDTSLLIIGAVSSAILAVTLSLVVRWFQSIKPIHAILAFLSLLLLIGSGSVYTTYYNRIENITIAGKLGSEPEILINMYKELIEDNDEHANVQLKPNFGKTTFLFSALQNDQIDIYPEFSGSVLETLVKGKVAKHQTAQETYDLAKNMLSKEDKLTYLKPMQYNNTYALAVTEKFKKENNLNNISDLAKINGLLKPGMTLEFIDRDDGMRGLQKAYGFKVSAKSMEPALRYEAINDGRINLVDAYATDSELKEYNLALLKDDKNFFPAYQGAPLMKTKFANQHPKVVKALNKLAGKISNQDMQEMNYAVNVKKEPAASVAHQYLVQHDLIKE
ncbi:ABC transporter permease/substrate-binding protein [Weissella koreensis]|uniref:ABC transporter permease/substrate-binding protein n=1 Tax=Weissella koreensis TaxID=165096 RepID=A0A7H1MLK2_9LACO|nr:ABC transporter permease/substrate-binding protein [Weissella koreensis]AVH75135.1 glycine/betaine ABC transporter permease [Weissella koreensis]EJF33546.1 glycine betaine/carnitine/choline ABC transporter, substrate binding and permease protein [Weissella koreensis KCTC 3621]QGN20359.1 ABC transporter permease subunit [Weissella koreensis]QNT64338.1 ABC transporter permease/substrate-binding protein [Weissella koreensis]